MTVCQGRLGLHFAPETAHMPGEFNDIPTDIYALPQLGGCRFPRDQVLPGFSSITIASPMVPTEVMRKTIDESGNLATASTAIAAMTRSVRNGALGRHCQSCMDALALLSQRTFVVPLPLPRSDIALRLRHRHAYNRSHLLANGALQPPIYSEFISTYMPFSYSGGIADRDFCR